MGAISDPLARKFWSSRLAGRVSVSWERFATELCSFCGWSFNSPTADQREMLKYVRYMVGHKEEKASAESPPTTVTLEDFGKALSWFVLWTKGESFSSISAKL